MLSLDGERCQKRTETGSGAVLFEVAVVFACSSMGSELDHASVAVAALEVLASQEQKGLGSTSACLNFLEKDERELEIELQVRLEQEKTQQETDSKKQ